MHAAACSLRNNLGAAVHREDPGRAQKTKSSAESVQAAQKETGCPASLLHLRDTLEQLLLMSSCAV